jgi:serine protease inhibitor
MNQGMKTAGLLCGVLGLFGTLLAGCGAASSGKPAAELSTRDRAALAQQVDARIAQATNAFGLELARKLADARQGENTIVSPLSVMQALAMTWNGAAGATRAAMAKALRLDNGLTAEEVNRSERVLTELLQKSSPGVKLLTANSLWLQKDWTFRQPYLETVRQSYGAALYERELTAPKTRQEINGWVKNETNGRIPSIVDEPVSERTKLMLVNALYLNAAWETPFDKSRTKDGDFTLGNGTVKTVPMMRRSGRFAYDEEDAYQAVRLPYGDGQLSMLIVLPKPGVDRKALADRLFDDPEKWTKPFQGFLGELALPRFRAEMTASLEGTLAGMGMSAAFDPKAADFSAMADTSREPLYISRVLHKTYLDVMEKGTEAAAATAIDMKAGSAPPSGKFIMTVDRPFWFAITDDQSRTLLFAGSVEKP